MSPAGLEEVGTYVLHRQNTITQYIATRPILELCLEAERRAGEQVARRCREQGGLDLEGERAAAKAVEEEAVFYWTRQ